MAKQVVLTEDAYLDLEKAEEYYFAVSEALKQRFESVVLDALQRLGSNPVSFKRFKKQYRSFTLDVFPYTVYYKETADQIIIAAIVHGSRGNAYLKERL